MHHLSLITWVTWNGITSSFCVHVPRRMLPQKRLSESVTEKRIRGCFEKIIDTAGSFMSEHSPPYETEISVFFFFLISKNIGLLAHRTAERLKFGIYLFIILFCFVYNNNDQWNFRLLHEILFRIHDVLRFAGNAKYLLKIVS